MLNGDALALPPWPPRPGARWNTRLMMVESDRLATPVGMEHREVIRKGIEFDEWEPRSRTTSSSAVRVTPSRSASTAWRERRSSWSGTACPPSPRGAVVGSSICTTRSGPAILNVSGALLHRSRLDMAESTYLVGYNDLAADLEDAMSHPDVHAVLQVYDSPGGEAQGALEYAQRIFDLRGRKPMHAIADGMALSAAYLGASAADEGAVTITGYAGSVGVVSRHVDFSRALDQDGITVTHIFAGAHKVDGNPYEPLAASAAAIASRSSRKSGAVSLLPRAEITASASRMLLPCR